MIYNILNFITNTSNKYSALVVATYDNIDGAKVKYHQLLASLHNSSDVKTASVLIVNQYGREVAGYFEMVSHETADKTESEA